MSVQLVWVNTAFVMKTYYLHFIFYFIFRDSSTLARTLAVGMVAVLGTNIWTKKG